MFSKQIPFQRTLKLHIRIKYTLRYIILITVWISNKACFKEIWTYVLVSPFLIHYCSLN